MKRLAPILTFVFLTVGPAWAEDPLCGNASRCVGRLEDDQRLTDFHIRVLETLRLPYKLEKHDDRVTVWWVPRSDAEEKEVDDRMGQYAGAIHDCAPDDWPTPTTPARAVFSCAKKR
jgi:hypothetical protein